MTITQTVEIPADRRIHLDLEVPLETPAGKARLEVKVIPVVDRQDEGAPRSAEEEATSPVDALVGILSGMGDIDPDDLRMERIMTKHLKHLK
jgi:hypothetical protein